MFSSTSMLRVSWYSSSGFLGVTDVLGNLTANDFTLSLGYTRSLTVGWTLLIVTCWSSYTGAMFSLVWTRAVGI